MGLGHPWHFDPRRPRRSLTYYFIIWKLLLLLIALASPGPGYDTSTVLALESESPLSNQDSYRVHDSLPFYYRIVYKLTRWDAIYFTKVAHDGYIFEQEWMAGWGFTKLLGSLSNYDTSPEPRVLIALVGIVTAHISHLFSVFVLYELGLLSLKEFPQPKRSLIALLAACLHIISPAGIFLSAPYAESHFSLMTFSGLFLYVKSLPPHAGKFGVEKDLYLLSSGLCLGLATTIRANGLLNGLLFVDEAGVLIYELALRKEIGRHTYQGRLYTVLLAGVLMGAIVLFPQYLAYLEYCTPSAKRLWCSAWPPSIYAWIQSEYWGVGFLRYWKIGNLPLLFLAAPMYCILFFSCTWAWTKTAPYFAQSRPNVLNAKPEGRPTVREGVRLNSFTLHEMPWRLTIPQLALASLSLTTYHFQIITRLSSGCPVWYWWLAYVIVEDDKVSTPKGTIRIGALITRWMVVYAVVQGGLFASFLPPA